MESLRYETGNEHSPTDPFGRISLRIAGDGGLRLDHYGWEGHRAWTATVDPAVIDRLRAALVAAGFPAAQTTMPPPDERMVELVVTGEPAGTALLPWDDARRLPGYDDVLGVLDGLAVQIAGLDLPAPAVPVASDVRQVE